MGDELSELLPLDQLKKRLEDVRCRLRMTIDDFDILSAQRRARDDQERSVQSPRKIVGFAEVIARTRL